MPNATFNRAIDRMRPRVQLERGAIHYFFVAQKLFRRVDGYEMRVARSLCIGSR